MKNILCLLLAITFTVSLSQAQKELTLGDAIRIGLEKNYQIQIGEKNLEIAQNNNTWGVAGALPSLDLTLTDINRMDVGPNMVTGIEETTKMITLSPGASVNWILFNGFRIKTTKDNLEQLEALTSGNAALIVENTIQSIVLAYYQVLLEKDKRVILNELVKLSKDRYDYLLQKKELGNAVTYDVIQAKTAFLSDSANVIMQDMNVRNSTMNLNLLLGEPTGTAYVLIDQLPLYLNDYQLGDLIQKMTSNNKTLQNQYINQNLLSNSTKIAKSSLYPIVSMRAGTDFSQGWQKFDEADWLDGNSYDFYANLSLSFNLFNGGATAVAIKNARIDEEIGMLRIEEMERNLTILMNNMYYLYNVRKQLYLVSDETLKSSELNMQLSEERFKAGTINSFNYRDVQVQYLNAAFNKLQAIYNLIDTHTELLRLSGGIINEYEKN